MRVQLLLLVAALTAETTATGSDASSSSSFLDDVLRYVYRCRTSDWHECVERDLTRTVDAVMAAKNDTYRLNQYLTVTVAAAQETGNDTVARARNDGLVPRIVDLFNALRVRYQPEERTADDDVFEGRKKKKGNKHKMGLMMASGAMAMSVIGGMMMKMKMHFVLLIAIKALIIAKLALLLAGAVALKKLMGGSGGGGGGVSVQPVWNSGGGGGSGAEHGGYRRSYGQTDDGVDRIMSEAAGAMAYGEQLQS